MADLVIQILNGLNYILILILVAMGLVIIFGLMSVINMAHGELFLLGAYTAVMTDQAGLGFWPGVFLAPADVEIELPAGLGARHAAAAAVTKRTTATAVVVSATDGNLRTFSGGKMVLQMDPEVAYGPVAIER